MAWLTRQKEEYVICLQEPLITKKGLSRLPLKYEAFWKEISGPKFSRVAIISPRSMHGYMISQASSRNCVIVRFPSLNMSIASVYMDINECINDSFHEVMHECSMGKHILMCADTNAHNSAWGATGNRQTRIKSYHRGDQIVEWLDELDMSTCNITPHKHTYIGDTGHETHVDATFCSSVLIHKIHEWEVLHERFESDHRIIKFKIHDVKNGREDSNVNVHVTVPWKKPTSALLQRLHECLPKMVKYKRRVAKEGDIDVFVQMHTREVQKALERLCSESTRKQQRNCYWWTTEVHLLHRQMKRARRRAGRYKHAQLKHEYNVCRQRFRAKVREVKILKWREYTSEIDDPWKGLMGILTRLNHNKALNRTLCDTNGVYANDISTTLLLLGQQFYPTPAGYTTEQIEVETQVKLRLEEVGQGEGITVCEFRKAISEMKKATAPGADSITNSVLQILAKQCGYEKTYIELFNACLTLGVFPTVWKCAKIVLIPKPSAEVDSVKALRPISLTSVFSKLLERIVLARIQHYLELSGNLALSQHAYRKGGSTTTALYEAATFVQDALKDKQVCIIVFLDISGAFDRTWHGGILNRLLQYGVPVYLVRWVKAFLADRTACFKAGVNEHVVELNQGCPQGGVLSPVLWNVMFNDMLTLKTRSNQDFHLKIVGYADDAAVLCRAGSVKNASVSLTKFLVRIKQWADKNRVQFNAGKLSVLTINRNFSKPPAEVYFDGKLIREVTQYKYLGVIFDRRFSWKPHVHDVLGKLAGITRMLRGAVRESWGVRLNIMRMIYKAVFCPILLYGMEVWGWRMTGVTMCAKFDRVIRKFCIMSTRCFRTTSNEVLFQYMKTAKFALLSQQQTLRISLLQLNLARRSDDHVFQRDSVVRRTSPMSMSHFFFLCKQGLSCDSLNVVYENLLNHYRDHPHRVDSH